MTKTLKRQGGAFGAFLRDIGASCYDMARYRDFRAMPVLSAFRYFIVFCLLVAVVYALAAIPGTVGVLRDVRSGVATALPDGTSFAVERGSFSTDLEMPYEHHFEGFLLRIDTAITGTSFDTSGMQDTSVIIGKDALFFVDASSVQAYSLKDIEDVRFSKEDLAEWLRRNGILAVTAAVVAFGIGYLFALVIGSGLFVLLASFAALFLARLWRVRMPYAAWLSVGLHAVTLPVIADVVFDTLIAPLPFIFSVLFLMVVIAVAADERSDPVFADARQ